MKSEDFAKLKEGSIIRNRATGEGFIVLYKHFQGQETLPTYTVARVIEATNPMEWEKME